MTSDTVRLRIPYSRPWAGVARLVLGGVAARLALPYEQLQDLELALDSLLAEEAYGGEQITVQIEVTEALVALRLGPLDGKALRRDLAREVSGEIGLRRLLEAVTERIELGVDGDGDWLRLEKRRSAPGRAMETADAGEG